MTQLASMGQLRGSLMRWALVLVPGVLLLGLLSAQLCSPVRWRQTLETFAGLGLTSLVELGPGGVLSGLAKRSLPEIQSLAVSKPEDLDTLIDQISAAGTWRRSPSSSSA